MNNIISSINSLANSLFGSSGRSPHTRPSPGSAPIIDNQSSIEAKKNQLKTLVMDIKTEFRSLAPTLSGGGAIPCDSGVYLPFIGITFRLCFSEYADVFLMIGNALFAVCSFTALALILG